MVHYGMLVNGIIIWTGTDVAIILFRCKMIQKTMETVYCNDCKHELQSGYGEIMW